MSDLADLVHRNLADVFDQRSELLRVLAMTELYAADATFTDHDGVVTGIDAINAKINDLHARTPGFTFTPTEFHEVQELGSLSWSYGPEGAAPAVTGTDIVIVANGRIAKLYTYLTS